MRGEITGVWSETWREIWSDLANYQNAPKDLFSELYAELVKAFAASPDGKSLVDISNNPDLARELFKKTKVTEFQGEIALRKFFENAHKIIDDLGGDLLSNRYFFLTQEFLVKYSLRYDLRRPFNLSPTLPGMFTRLIQEIREAAEQDSELSQLMAEFEDTIRDLKTNQSAGKIKTCIQKQTNLLEAIGKRNPGVSSKTLGTICDEVKTWPHNALKESMKKIYKFASDYPGIRHAGTEANRLRDVDMRDLIAVSILLAGFLPYLTDLIDFDTTYQGS